METSVNDIVENLKAISKSDFEIEYMPKRLGEVERIYLANSHAGKTLNWSPEVNFYDGLEKTWQWFKENN